MSKLAEHVQALLASGSRSDLEQWLIAQTRRLEDDEIPVEDLEEELEQGILVYRRLKEFLEEDRRTRERIQAILARDVLSSP